MTGTKTYKRTEDVNHLPTRKVGRNRFVSLDDAKRWAANYNARRDARARDKLTDQDLRKALKSRTPKK